MGREDQRQQEKIETRKKRIPFGVPRRKLDAPERDGYVRRWVADRPGRIQAAQDGGYEFVTDQVQTGDAGSADVTMRKEVGSAVSRFGGTDDSGKPINLYLMEIKKEWYDQDQAEKGLNVSLTEDALRRGAQGDGAVSEQSYVPREGIKIESRKG